MWKEQFNGRGIVEQLSDNQINELVEEIDE
jgi:hypothetical protein